jgi:antitoxin component YwqK of YwqJK toxin-antitoxin module
LVSYHRNGSLWEKGEYKSSKMEGIWVVFYENGEPVDYLTGNFKKGVKIGD